MVLRGAGCCNQGGINDRDLAHRHAPRTEVGIDGLKDLLTKVMHLQQVPEGQDRGLIGDPIADQLDAGKGAHVGHLDQGLLHGWVAQRIPLLHKMNPQHGGQRIGKTAT